MVCTLKELTVWWQKHRPRQGTYKDTRQVYQQPTCVRHLLQCVWLWALKMETVFHMHPATVTSESEGGTTGLMQS